MPRKKGLTEIDTVPLPEKPSIDFRIPPGLLKEFGNDIRIVVRHPWVVGIPVPDRLLTPELRRVLGKDFEFIVTPIPPQR